MSYEIEDKVVQMQFDNSKFEPNVEASIKTLSKLEKALALTDGTKGFEELNKTSKNFNLNPAITAVESLQKGFSALEVIGITVLSNLTNKAMAMASKIMYAFGVEPLTSGFAEYSEQMSSTQVIMSNTGDTLQDVTKALDELNVYADKTIYSFGQMTQAIGKFAAAGVELGPATKAIQGLSSAAATVGANNQQLFSAYYNLAQSMQLGYLQLIDWKSLENSTIGNKTMRTAFIKTAEAMGTFTKAGIEAKEAYADFRGSLNKKWLTSEVIIATLNKYSRDIQAAADSTEWAFEEFDEAGKHLNYFKVGTKNDAGEVVTYIDEMGKSVEAWEVELAATAHAAATEIKSFKQMWETLTEAAGTGWAETWKIIFGDLNESKKLWTGIGNSIEKVITAFTNLRNHALEAWDAVGGREDLVAALQNIADGFKNFMLVISKALAKLMGVTDDNADGFKLVGEALSKVTRNFRIFTEVVKISDDEVEHLSDELYVLLKPLKVIGNIIAFIVKVIAAIIIMTVAIGKTILYLIGNLQLIPEILKEVFGTEEVEKFETAMKGAYEAAKPFAVIFKIIGKAIELVCIIFDKFVSLIVGFISQFTSLEIEGYKVADIFKMIGRAILGVLNIVYELLDVLGQLISGKLELGPGVIQGAADSARDFVSGIVNTLKDSKLLNMVANLAAFLGNALVSGFRGPKGLDENSTSKKAIEAVKDFADGVKAGSDKNTKEITKSGDQMGNALVKSFKGSIGGSEGLQAVSEVYKKSGLIDNATKSIITLKDKLNSLAKDSSQELSNLDILINTLVVVSNRIDDFINSITLADVIIVGLAASIGLFVFNVARIIGEAKEVVEGIGRIVKGIGARIWAEAFDQIGQAIFNIAKALALIALVSAWNPDALKQASIVILLFITLVTTLVVLFGKLYGKVDELKGALDKKQIFKNLGNSLKKSLSLTSLAIMITALSASVLILTNALLKLSSVDTKALYKGLGVLEILMASMVAVIVVLTKFTPKLSFGTLVIFAYAYALKIFTNALSNIGGEFNENIKKLTNLSLQEVATLAGLIAGLTILSAYINKAAFALSKVVASLGLLTISVGVMGFMLGIFKDNPIFMTLVDTIIDFRVLTGMIITLAAMMATMLLGLKLLTKIIKSSKLKKDELKDTFKELTEQLKQLTISLLTISASIAIITAAIGVLYYNFGSDTTTLLLQSMLVIAVVTTLLGGMLAAIVGLASIIQKNKIEPKYFAGISNTMKIIAPAIISLTLTMLAVMGVMALFWNGYSDEPEKGLLVIGSTLGIIAAVTGMVAGLVAVIGRNLRGTDAKGALVVLIPLMGLIGELMISMALFSTLEDPRQLIMGAAAIQAVMIPIVALVTMLRFLMTSTSTIKDLKGKKIETTANMFANVQGVLITLLTSIAIIFAEMAAFAIVMQNANVDPIYIYSAMGSIVTVFAGVSVLIGVFSSFLTKLSKIGNYENLNKSIAQLNGMLGILTGFILVLGGTIALLAKSGYSFVDVDAIIGGFVFALSALMAAMGYVVKELSKTTITEAIFEHLTKMFISLTAAIAVIGGTISSLRGMNFVTVAAYMVTLILGLSAIMAAITYTIKTLLKSPIDDKAVNDIGKMLIGIGGALLILAGVLNSLRGMPVVDVTAKLGVLMGSIAIIGGIVFLLSKFGNTSNNSGLVKAGQAMVLISTSIAILAGSVGLMALALKDVQPDTVEQIIKVITSFLGLSTALIAVTTAIGKIGSSNSDTLFGKLGLEGKNDNVGYTIKKMAEGLLILSAALFVVSTIPADKLNNVIGAMYAMMSVMLILSVVTTVMSKIASNAAGIAASMILISTGMLMMSSSMLVLAMVPAEKINTVIKTLLVLSGVLLVLSAAAAAISNLAQYALIGAAVFIAIGVSMIAGATAITILANAPLEELAEKLSFFSDQSVIKGMWAFVGAFSALAIGLTLGGPGIIFAALAMGVMALTINSIASSAERLASSADGIVALFNALASVKDIVGPLTKLLWILTIFNPTILISSLSLSLFTGVLALFIRSIAMVISSLDDIASDIISITTALSYAGHVVTDNDKYFKSLASTIAMFGAALLPITLQIPILAIGIITIAASIALVVVALGAAIGLATPAIATISLALIALEAIILAMKDAAIKLFNAVVDRLPEIINAILPFADKADALQSIATSLLILGAGLMTLGLGGVLAAASILAFAGALKVFDNVIKSITGHSMNMEWIVKVITDLASEKDNIDTINDILLELFVGLALFGAGLLGTSVALLAFSGALALFAYVLSKIDIDNIIYFINELYNVGGKLFALFLAMIPTFIGLVLASVGLLLFSAALAAFAGSLALLGTLGFDLYDFILLIDDLFVKGGEIAALGAAFIALGIGLTFLAVPLTIISPLISTLAISLIPFVLALNGLVLALTLLTNSCDIVQLGQGLLLLAAGFAALAIVSVIINPIIPLIYALISVLIQLAYTFSNVIGPAIEAFALSISNAAGSIGTAMLNISSSFYEAVVYITNAVREIMGLVSEGITAAGNFVSGFVGTIRSNLGEFASVGIEAAQSVLNGFNGPEGQDAHSPSWAMIKAAGNFIAGFVQAIGKGEDFATAGKTAATAACTAFDNEMGDTEWYKSFKDNIANNKVVKAVKSGIDVVTGKVSLGDAANKIFGEGSFIGKAVSAIKGILTGEGFDFGDIADKLGMGDLGKMFDNVTSGLGDVSSAASNAKGTIESLTDTVKNQMKVFERFTADEDLMDPKELINNMESQLRGVQNWANGIDTLAVRGMSAPLLKYLSEMGPEGYKYVEAFLEMTEDEFAQANDLYLKSVEMPDSVANQIADSYRRVGAEIVEATSSAAGGIGSASDETKQKIIDGASEAGQAVIDEAVKSGTITVSDIRDLAGEAGSEAIIYYSDELKKWLSSSEYEELKDQLGSVFQFNAGDLMKKTANGTKKWLDTTGKSLQNNDWLKEIGKSNASYYIEGFGDPKSGQEYIAACMEKGYLLSATVEEGIDPKNTGSGAANGIVESMSDTLNDGANQARLYDSVDNLINNTVIKRSEEAIDELKEVGKNYGLGLAEGIESTDAERQVFKSIDEFTNKTNKYLKEDKLQERSPSKLTEEFGMNYVLGFVNGVSEYTDLAKEEVGDFGDSSLNPLSQTIRSLSEYVTDNLDTAPTIRPVLDLTNVYDGVNQLDALFSTRQASIAANAYTSMRSSEDGVSRLQSAIDAANARMANQIVAAIQQSDKEVIVNVNLNGSAADFFDAMVDQTITSVKTSGRNPLLVTRNNQLNAGKYQQA